MLDVKVVTWPRGEDSLFMPVIAGLLAGRGQTLPPPALRDDGAEPVDILVGTRLIVEYEEFCYAAAMRFVAAGGAAKGTAGGNPVESLDGSPDGSPEDVDAFLRFASADFAAHRDFMLAWGDHEAPDGRIVVPRAALRADPGPWLAWISGMLDPALLLHGAALEEACDHVRRHAVAPAPAVLAKLDVSLIDQLHRITMDRETVSGVFLEVLGRPPRDEGILRFQAMPDTEALRTALMDSAEYQTRKALRGDGDAPPATEAEVQLAYRLLLGRDGSPAEVQRMLMSGASVTRLRAVFLNAGEFGDRLRQFHAGSSRLPVIVHLHIPKNAGTSLTKMIAAQFRPEQLAPLGDDGATALAALPPARRVALRFVFGHLQHGVAARLGRPVLHVCTLRRPGPRILSYYSYIRRRSDHPLHARLQTMGFGAFLEFCATDPGQRAEVDNGQIRVLAGRKEPGSLGQEHAVFRQALSNILAPDMVYGLTERFDAFLADLATRGVIPAEGARTVENAAPEPTDIAAALAELTPDQRGWYDVFTYWDTLFYDICATCLFGPGGRTDGY